MGSETELKFNVAPKDLRKLRTARPLHRKRPEEKNLVSVYFDTPKHKLAKKGVSLRVRRDGNNRIQTIKTDGSKGSIIRGEWEHKIKGDVPNLRKARDTALARVSTRKLKRHLRPIFETHIHRTTLPFRRNGSWIEVALDRGRVRAGRLSAPIAELELERKRGGAGEVFKLARKLGELVPATLSLKSKSERGYDLIENRRYQAVPAEEIRVRRGTSTLEAFRTICRSILRHITANQPAVEKSDPEGVHQMRVGLRRLRAAISLFALGDKQTKWVKTELKWLTGELAPARDLDVYVSNKIEPLRGTRPAKRGMKELAGTLASRRDAAFGKARFAVNSSRYRLLLLNTLQWLENGEWAKRSFHYGKRPIEHSATDILARRTKKVRKKAERLRKLDSGQRHKLRIAVKKLRYACDFFGPLFTGHRAKKRLSAFEALLKSVQDHLGALNDIKVHQQLAPKLAAGKPSTRGRQQAFAVGVVTGQEQREIEPHWKAAIKDAKKFAQAQSFWS
jgi:inorganic triphosphatase YgiF